MVELLRTIRDIWLLNFFLKKEFLMSSISDIKNPLKEYWRERSSFLLR